MIKERQTGSGDADEMGEKEEEEERAGGWGVSEVEGGASRRCLATLSVEVKAGRSRPGVEWCSPGRGGDRLHQAYMVSWSHCRHKNMCFHPLSSPLNELSPPSPP